MAGNDNDIFVIITLWLLYIGIHVVMDFFERRARRSAEEMEEREARNRPQGIYAEIFHGEGDVNRHHGSRTRQERRVVVIGTETSAAGMTDGAPCEGALVPDANGRMPQPPEPVLYGEASYAARGKGDEEREESKDDDDDGVHVRVDVADEKAEKAV